MTTDQQREDGRTRAEQYATRFEQANDDLLGAVRDCSADQWQLPCPNDGRSVGLVVRHVAEVYPAFSHILATLQRGEQFSPSASMEDVDRENAEQARSQPDVAKPQTLTLLHDGAAEIMGRLRAIRDDQLDATAGNFGGHELSVAQVIEYVVIGHTAEHLGSVRGALAG